MIFGPEDTNVAEGRANSPSNHMLPETLGQHLFYSLHYRCKYIFKQQPVLYVACFRSAQIKQILISFAQRSNNFYIGLADWQTDQQQIWIDCTSRPPFGIWIRA